MNMGPGWSSGAHARAVSKMWWSVLVADVHPANHRAIRRFDDAALDACICHNRAADESGRNADAETAPAPAVTAPAVATPVTMAPGGGGSGRKRNCAKGGRRSENESHLTEHEGL